MEHKKIIASIVVLILIIAGMFVYTYLKKTELNAPDTKQTTETESESRFSAITRIDAKHFFTAPTHTIAGEILMPTPCDLLNWDTRVLESNPTQVIVDFTVINHAETCAQVVTQQRFKVSFDAQENAIIRATLEGVEIELNLVPALPGESVEDFELFIKG